MDGRLLARGEETYHIEAAAGGRKDRNWLSVRLHAVPCLGIERTDHGKPVLRNGDAEVKRRGLAFPDGELAHRDRHAAVGQAVAAHKHIVADIKRSPFLEYVSPADAASHVHLTLVKGQKPCATVLYLTDCEVGIVVRIGKDGRRLIVQHQRSGRSHNLRRSLEINIHPLPGILVLDLSRDRILAGIKSESPRKGDKEDIPGTGVRHSRLIDSGRRHRNAPGLRVAQHRDAVIHPLDQIGRTEQFLLLQSGSETPGEEGLVGAEELVLHPRTENRLRGVVTIVKNLPCHIYQILVAQRLQ